MKPDRWKQVEQLYHAALERAPEERAAFLAEACTDDSDLRREVEELLGYDGAAESFIEENAMAMAAQELEVEDLSTTKALGLAGQQIGAYKILAPLGKGGMGEVHLALDTRLERKVAVKLLPARFTTDAERLRRFAQEARAASALNHPNIITIHEIGEVEDTHYIVTEYVEGETLRQRLANAPEKQMKPSEAIEMAAQIAAALSAAHEAGIAHRDIKPENVMLRRDGIIKVLDFGLAKLTETQAAPVDSQASTVAKLSTEAGVVMGTPRYMSPEQARGEKVDARTDIFSLGVMLYEMVTGRAPFTGATTSEVIAAILRDEPPPLAEAPPELGRIVHRALRKDRAERYQTAKALLSDLNQLKERLLVEKFVVPPSGGSSRRRTLPPEGGTTNKRRRAAIIALAAITISIAALAAWFYFNRAPILTGKDTILLADFENKTSDPVFDGTLKQALAIQLQQSPFVHIFPEARVQETLRLMNRPPDERVTAEIAREICERQGIKALIAGTIAPLGSHYVITLEAINAQNGETLSRQQAKAESREQALQALSQAARQLREKLGESLSSIQNLKPLLGSRTSKLEALKDRTRAGELGLQGRFVEAILFVERAVEIDPQYVDALHYLSILHNATGQPESAAKYAEQAFLLRDWGSEFEKPTLTCWYHILVTGNQKKRLEALRLRKQIYPTFGPAYNDLALVYNMVGQS